MPKTRPSRTGRLGLALALSKQKTAGIHVKGGTILKTTNSGNPLAFPVAQPDGTIQMVNRCPELVEKIKKEGFHAVINVGGDGSQRGEIFRPLRAVENKAGEKEPYDTCRPGDKPGPGQHRGKKQEEAG